MSSSLLVAYCVLIVTASVMGGLLPSFMRMTHLRTQLLMSFVAGLMLGIAMLHLLPHATDLLGSASLGGGAALLGVLAMFLLMRAFHVHAHGDFDESENEGDHGHEHADGHGHSCNHDHGKEIGWVGMFFGLALHTLMDGVALGASMVAEASHHPYLGLAGLGTFLAVVLHKPLDAFAITSMMKKGGWSKGQQACVNFLFSLACPAGALLFYFGIAYFTNSEMLLGWGLALSAGFFICISLADLLPEVSFHQHDRLKLTTALLLGVILAFGIENLPGHSHDVHEHEPHTARQHVDHSSDHSDHSHDAEHAHDH